MDTTSAAQSDLPNPLTGPIAAALISWAAISLGFLGLKILMQERPEFVGQPMRVTQAELIQESPRVVSRKVTDDISIIKSSQPESSEISIEMTGRRDYRGLRTIRDMAGTFRGEFALTNAAEEASFVLFKCPHPRTENADGQNLLAGELKMQSPAEGMQESTKDSWCWSGTLEAHGSAKIAVSYQVSSLKAVTYRITPLEGGQVKQLRVAFHRKDLDSMRFESGAGTRRPSEDMVVWERKDFLAPDFFSAEIEESRNLFGSLSRLLEIGPVICLLFLASVCAVLVSTQKLTAIQMFTIAAGYALYFPLILYLSANLSFIWALLIALAIPGVLLMNYARWLVGGRLGLIGAGMFLLLYQVFPTLAAFAGWNRGTVLLGLGVITLAVLINLQNRSLRRRAIRAAAIVLITLFPIGAGGADVQVVFPAEIASRFSLKGETTNPIVAFEPGEYRVGEEAGHFQVEARLPFRIVRAGEVPVPLFALPLYLQTSKVESSETDFARLVTLSNRPAVFAERAGEGVLRLGYRVPIENREGKKRVQIPLALGCPASVRLDSARADVEILSGTLWSKTNLDKKTVYDIGAAGQESLVLEWHERPEGAEQRAAGSKEFYGIGLTRAQNLTIINSDSSCTHFAEFEIPVSQSQDFRMKLPANARLISVSVNGVEIASPHLEGQTCRVRLPPREEPLKVHRLSFRIAYPPMRLGFLGVLELSLPELILTAGTLEWVVALPNGFETQVISCGLEIQKSIPELGRFGDYGRILQSHTNIFLAKDLAPPTPVNLSLKYRQTIPGF